MGSRPLQNRRALPPKVTQSRPKDGTWHQNGAPKLTFRSSTGPFFSKIRVSGLRPEPCYLLCFRDIQLFVMVIIHSWTRINPFCGTRCQLFSLWGPSGVEKYAQWNTQGSPKTPKGTQSGARGTKWLQKGTLKPPRVPKVFPEVSGVPPLTKKTSKRHRNSLGNPPFSSKKYGNRFLKVGLQKHTIEMNFTVISPAAGSV